MAQETMLTLLIQIDIKSRDDDDYITKRDRLIDKLEKLGFNVNIEDESMDDDELEDDEEENSSGWE